MEYFTWNIDLNFTTVIKTSIQGSVYGYSGSYTKEIYDGADIPATPRKKQQQLKFPVHISHGLQPVDGNIIILTKYFALCTNIQRASVAFSLQDWHVLYCPRTFIWCFRVLDLVEWSCIHSVMSFLTFLKRALFSRLSLRHNLQWGFNKASKC